MSAQDRVLETYHAALQHDNVELPTGTFRAGVVRRPTGWFRSVVDDNFPHLGPPAQLLDDVKEAQRELERELDEVAAHNAAWDAVEFERRYSEYLCSEESAQEALAALAKRVRSGQPVALVCFEGDDKRCHRHHLRERLEARVS
ncbi:MAG: DUF488 domain-containing protein [Salinirussus sp.]